MDAIRDNGFSLEILDHRGPVEKIIYRNSNYYGLPDGSEYKIRLGNSTGARVDAHVWVDGEKVGIWRIKSFGRILIERPVSFSRKFTLLKDGTRDAYERGMVIGSPNNGVVKVTFRPEVQDFPYGPKRHGLEKEYLFSSEIPRCNAYTDTVTPYTNYNQNCMLSTPEYENKIEIGMKSDRTALGRNSNQKYKHVVPLSDIDYDNITTIYTRLVVDNDRTTYKRNYLTLREGTRTYARPPRMDVENPSRPHICNSGSRYILSRKYYFDSQ